MPKFVYFATFDESISLLEDFFLSGFSVIAEPGLLDEPEAPSFSRVTEELLAILKITPTYYLTGDFTRFPTQYSRLPSGKAMGKYMINFVEGGPLMQAMISRMKVVDGKPKILEGSVSYQRLYGNPETGEWEKPSDELLAAYRRAVTLIKKKCKPAKNISGKFIASEALKLIETGGATI